MLRKKTGDAVGKGEALADLHVNEADEALLQQVIGRVREAFQITEEKPTFIPPLVYAVVTRHGVQRKG